MAIPGNANLLLLTEAAGAAPTGYSIDRSVRFNSADSAYLNRTPSTAGNRKTWTWAGWVKRSKLAASQVVANSDGGTSDSTYTSIQFLNSDVFRVGGYNTVWRDTTAVFRDASAWYHFVVAVDTTQSTANNRIRVYANGVEVASFSTLNNPSQNSDLAFNQTAAHNIGKSYLTAGHFDGYLADIHFIDGQALDPTSFGEFDDNGIWQPIAYSGSYGTNGFHLPFNDNSTAAALGTDTSGNSNTWTVNNISVAAGAGNDSVVDSPTNGTQTDTGAGGEVVGNYCTWNPLANTGLTLANGNLDASKSTAGWQSVEGTIAVSSGKYYWEVVLGGSNTQVGIVSVNANVDGDLAADLGLTDTGNGYAYAANNGVLYGKSSTSSSTATAGDVLGFALDLDGNTLSIYKNNSALFSSTSIQAGLYVPAIAIQSTATAASANFGQRPFAYTAPSGYKALCTANLPTPTIEDGSTAMDVKLYTGNGSTQTISGLNFSPDFLWIKTRNAAYNHHVYDSVRGVDKFLRTNTTASEYTVSPLDQVTSFNSDGFSLGADNASPGAYEVNELNKTYVAWTWDAGSSNATNTDGSITSTVRANPTAGFSVITATTPSQTTNYSVGHGLGVTPEFYLWKFRAVTSSWIVYHKSIAPYTLKLDSTAAQYTGFNMPAPSSTLINLLDAPTAAWNSPFVIYAFAPVEGYSAFGSFEANGTTDNAFVFCGFRPRYIMAKQTTGGGGNWFIADTARDTYNVQAKLLDANVANQERTANIYDILSNGFKVRFALSGTFVYCAFAENPFALNARAR